MAIIRYSTHGQLWLGRRNLLIRRAIGTSRCSALASIGRTESTLQNVQHESQYHELAPVLDHGIHVPELMRKDLLDRPMRLPVQQEHTSKGCFQQSARDKE